MLQSLRDNLKGTVAVIVIGLMVIPLMFFGVDALFMDQSNTTDVAEVNGETITESDLQRAIHFRRQELRSQFGDNLPEEFFSDENLRKPVLNTLAKQKVLVQTAQSMGMAIPDERVNQAILNTEDFRVDGRFDQERFRRLVANVGYTPLGYRDQLAEDYLLRQHVVGYTAGGFVTERELERMVALSQQRRDFYYLTIPLGPIEAEVDVSDEEAQAHYEQNQDQYRRPEQVAIEYLELRTADLQQSVAVSEDELRAQYEQEVAAFQQDIQRHASHILLEPQDDRDEQAVLAEIQQRLEDGEDFAALAEEYSDDLGSSSSGGDLGYTSGDVFPEPFEAALANLEVGEVSAPVETDAGYHLIKLLDVEGVQPPSFDEDRDRIERAIRRSRAEDRFVELQQDLGDLAYNAESLAPVAEQLGLELKTSEPFGREGGFGIASNPKVVEEAFSDDVLGQGNTSRVLELSPEHQLVLRVTDHQSARVLDFAEVEDRVVNQVRRQKADQQALEIARELQAEVAGGQSVEDVAKQAGYEWQVKQQALRSDGQTNREVLSHVFSLKRPDNGGVVSNVSLSNGDYAVVHLTKVKEGDLQDMSESERANLRRRLADQWSGFNYVAYETLLWNQAEVDLKDNG